MIKLPTDGLTEAQALNLVPVISEYLKNWITDANITVENYNLEYFWNIEGTMSPNLRDFLIVQLADINMYGDYYYIGNDPIFEYLLNQRKLRFVVFNNLLLSPQRIDLKAIRENLIIQGYRFLLGSRDTEMVERLGKIIFIGETGIVLKIVGETTNIVSGNLENEYQKLIRGKI